MPPAIGSTEQAILATLLVVTRALGWRWQEVYRYCGISNVYGLRLRTYFQVAPIRPWGSYRRNAEWMSNDEFDEWFIENDRSSVFRRQPCAEHARN